MIFVKNDVIFVDEFGFEYTINESGEIEYETSQFEDGMIYDWEKSKYVHELELNPDEMEEILLEEKFFK